MLAAASCARQQQNHAVDPATAQPVAAVMQPQYARQPAAGERGLFSSQALAPAQPARQSYAQQADRQPAAQPAARAGAAGSIQAAAHRKAYAPLQPPTVVQYSTPQYAAPQAAVPAAPQSAQNAYASASPYRQPYTLDAGDKLRIAGRLKHGYVREPHVTVEVET